MIYGAHLLLYSTDAEADRRFFQNVLKWPHVDAGHGWLIFKLPPAELAVHPAGHNNHKHDGGHAMLAGHLYLMCKDLKATIRAMKARKVQCSEVTREAWGFRTTVKLPSGSEIGLYQPTHRTAIGLKRI